MRSEGPNSRSGNIATLLSSYYGRSETGDTKEESQSPLPPPPPSELPPQSKRVAKSDPLDLTAPDFDVNRYFQTLVHRADLPELLKETHRLSAATKEVEVDLQMLVLEHYTDFITSADTIAVVRDTACTVDDKMQKVASSLGSIENTANELRHQTMQRSQRMNSLLTQRELMIRMKIICELPVRVRDYKKSRQWSAVMRLVVESLPTLEALQHISQMASMATHMAEEARSAAKKMLALLEDPAPAKTTTDTISDREKTADIVASFYCSFVVADRVLEKSASSSEEGTEEGERGYSYGDRRFLRALTALCHCRRRLLVNSLHDDLKNAESVTGEVISRFVRFLEKDIVDDRAALESGAKRDATAAPLLPSAADAVQKYLVLPAVSSAAPILTWILQKQCGTIENDNEELSQENVAVMVAIAIDIEIAIREAQLADDIREATTEKVLGIRVLTVALRTIFQGVYKSAIRQLGELNSICRQPTRLNGGNLPSLRSSEAAMTDPPPPSEPVQLLGAIAKVEQAVLLKAGIAVTQAESLLTTVATAAKNKGIMVDAEKPIMETIVGFGQRVFEVFNAFARASVGECVFPPGHFTDHPSSLLLDADRMIEDDVLAELGEDSRVASNVWSPLFHLALVRLNRHLELDGVGRFKNIISDLFGFEAESQFGAVNLQKRLKDTVASLLTDVAIQSGIFLAKAFLSSLDAADWIIQEDFDKERLFVRNSAQSCLRSMFQLFRLAKYLLGDARVASDVSDFEMHKIDWTKLASFQDACLDSILARAAALWPSNAKVVLTPRWVYLSSIRTFWIYIMQSTDDILVGPGGFVQLQIDLAFMALGHSSLLIDNEPEELLNLTQELLVLLWNRGVQQGLLTDGSNSTLSASEISALVEGSWSQFTPKLMEGCSEWSDELVDLTAKL